MCIDCSNTFFPSPTDKFQRSALRSPFSVLPSLLSSHFAVFYTTCMHRRLRFFAPNERPSERRRGRRLRRRLRGGGGALVFTHISRTTDRDRRRPREKVSKRGKRERRGVIYCRSSEHSPPPPQVGIKPPISVRNYRQVRQTVGGHLAVCSNDRCNKPLDGSPPFI